MPSDLDHNVRARLTAAKVDAPDDVVTSLCRYLEVLARWNRRINLTAFQLATPTPHAIDRLIVEPLQAARFIRREDRMAVDVGSGGGSPALPLKIAAPWLHMVLIEARVRKSAFLREAVRELDLADVDVETMRLEENGHPRLNATADVVTLRAVRADPGLWRGVGALLGADGRVFWFSDGGDACPAPAGMAELVCQAPSDERAFMRVFSRI